jgi:hypothetical protein
MSEKMTEINIAGVIKEVLVSADPEFCMKCRYLEVLEHPCCYDGSALCNAFFDEDNEPVFLDIDYDVGWKKCSECKEACGEMKKRKGKL